MNLLITFILQSIIAALAITESGDTLVNINSRNMLVPASNMKVITTGAALNRLGGNYRWSTKIGYSGTIEDGTLHGDLYIIGGADPTLGSEVRFASPIEENFATWTDAVREAGINAIDGHVIGDGRYIEGPMEDATWLWEDLGTYYGTGVSGLSFFENRKDFEVSPGIAVGDSLEISEGYPETPWMTYRYDCLTGVKNSGDQLYLYTTRLAPYGSLTGTFAQAKKAKTVNCSNKYPEYTCASYFCNYLEAAGIVADKGPADIGTCFSAPSVVAQNELTVICTTKSPTLSKVIQETNFESNNFMAETLFRTLGKVVSGSGAPTASRSALNAELRRLGVPVSGRARVIDGSGLSRENYVSPGFFCAFLRAMMGSKEYKVFLESLPIVGRTGTVRSRLPNLSDAQKTRVRMKSGSMDGVRCYCGYILPSSAAGAVPNPSSVSGQTIIFSYMVNNSTASSSELNAAADRFITSLIR